MAVRWVRWLTPFQTLSRADQQLLLQESWKELFLLYLAQWSSPWDLGAILTQRLMNRQQQQQHGGIRMMQADDLLLATEIKTIQVHAFCQNFLYPFRCVIYFLLRYSCHAGIDEQVQATFSRRK